MAGKRGRPKKTPSAQQPTDPRAAIVAELIQKDSRLAGLTVDKVFICDFDTPEPPNAIELYRVTVHRRVDPDGICKACGKLV